MMQRPTPIFMFLATAGAIGLMLWLVTSFAALPQPVSASALRNQASLAQNPARVADPVAPAQKPAPTAAKAPTQKPAAKKAASAPEVAPAEPELAAIAQPEAPAADGLPGFIQQVADGRASHLVGAYVPGIFALPVVEQPEGQPNFVSEQDGVLTAYAAAQANGVTALLAHNNLSGREFAKITAGQQITLVYGDGSTRIYHVSARDEYQALDPRSPASDFIDLASGARLTSGDVFARYYASGPALVLQTCIEKDGDYYWGRLFLTAEQE